MSSSTTYENVSADLIWEVVNGRGAQLVKTRRSGGHSFSRDPFNLVNKHSKKHEGFAADKAISIQPSDKGGVVVTTKSGKASRPARATHATTFGGAASGRRIYGAVVGGTAKRGYRADLRSAAVARASAIKRSQAPHKERPAAKPRGSKARKAAEEA